MGGREGEGRGTREGGSNLEFECLGSIVSWLRDSGTVLQDFAAMQHNGGVGSICTVPNPEIEYGIGFLNNPSLPLPNTVGFNCAKQYL